MYTWAFGLRILFTTNLYKGENVAFKTDIKTVIFFEADPDNLFT